MSSSLEDLSREQLAALDGFLEALELPPRDEISMFDLRHYLQFMRARRFDMKKSVKMFKNCLEWRKSAKVNTVSIAPQGKFLSH